MDEKCMRIENLKLKVKLIFSCHITSPVIKASCGEMAYFFSFRAWRYAK
jgi:hypothetical protein